MQKRCVEDIILTICNVAISVEKKLQKNYNIDLNMVSFFKEFYIRKSQIHDLVMLLCLEMYGLFVHLFDYILYNVCYG